MIDPIILIRLFIKNICLLKLQERVLCSVVANMLDCNIIVSFNTSLIMLSCLVSS